MSYYNYTNDEENFSRQIIRYWSNFIKTGLVEDFIDNFYVHSYYYHYLCRNPNNNSGSIINSNIQWKPYTAIERNYIFFELNNIHNVRNYFDSMYDFWLECFQAELNGGCSNNLVMRIKKYLISYLIILLVLSFIIFIYVIYEYYRKKRAY